MLKKIVIGVLSTLLVGAVGASAYNAVSTHTSTPEAALAAPAAQQASAAPVISQGIGQAQVQQGSSLQAGQVEAGPVQWSAGLAPQGSGNQPVQAGQGQGQGQKQGQARGQGQQGSAGSTVPGTGTGVPDPQNGLQELVILTGTLSSYAAPNFTMLTEDGQTITAQLGNLNYLSSQGLELKEGDRLQVMGFWDPSGALAVSQITQIDTGLTVQLRDDLGRPSWRGGNH